MERVASFTPVMTPCIEAILNHKPLADSGKKFDRRLMMIVGSDDLGCSRILDSKIFRSFLSKVEIHYLSNLQRKVDLVSELSTK